LFLNAGFFIPDFTAGGERKNDRRQNDIPEANFYLIFHAVIFPKNLLNEESACLYR